MSAQHSLAVPHARIDTDRLRLNCRGVLPQFRTATDLPYPFRVGHPCPGGCRNASSSSSSGRRTRCFREVLATRQPA